MNLRSKLAVGVAAVALASGLSAVSQAADQTAQATATPPSSSTSAPPMPVTDVQDPKKTLVGAKVKDNKGEAVGEVKSVKLGTDGKIASVSVSFGTRTVALKADGLTFAQAENTVTSAQSKDDISKMP